VALTDDQKAMLRLLAQREQGYGDIAALTGQSVDDVRAKVKVALSALEGPGAAAEPLPVATEPAPSPSPPLPPSPPTESKPPVAAKRKPATARKPLAPRLSRLKLPEDQGAVWGLGAGLAVVLVLVVLLATGALGGGGSESSSTTSSTSESTTTSGGAKREASNTLKPTQAVLKPVGGGSAGGRALFGKNKKQVILLVQAKGLQPSPPGRTYTVSLVKSATQKLPLVATRVTKSGTIEGSFQVAPQVLGLLASGFDTMEVSLVSNNELGTALKAARSAKKAPSYSGTPVLRGAVTGAIVEAGEQGTVKP
jgi:hypothetical protein